MDCGPPGSSVHGILQARILEWFAIPFSKVFPQSALQMFPLYKLCASTPSVPSEGMSPFLQRVRKDECPGVCTHIRALDLEPTQCAAVALRMSVCA